MKTVAQIRETQTADAITLIEVMPFIPLDALLYLIAEHMTHRGDIEPRRLEAFANEMGQQAWTAARNMKGTSDENDDRDCSAYRG